jgi:hypothetical protein
MSTVRLRNLQFNLLSATHIATFDLYSLFSNQVGMVPNSLVDRSNRCVTFLYLHVNEANGFAAIIAILKAHLPATRTATILPITPSSFGDRHMSGTRCASHEVFIIKATPVVFRSAQ